MARTRTAVCAAFLLMLLVPPLHAQIILTVAFDDAGPKTSDGSYVYWVHGTYGEFCTTPGSIRRSHVLGLFPVETLYEFPCTDYPGPIVVSGANLYARLGDTLVRVPTTGGNATWTLSTPGLPSDLLVRDDRLFWHDDGGIKTATTSGTEVSALVAEPSFPSDIAAGLAVDAQFVYYVLLDYSIPNTYQIKRVPRAGGAATVLASGQVNYSYAPRVVGVDETVLYLVAYRPDQETTLSIMNKSGGAPSAFRTTSGTYIASVVVKESLGAIWLENFRSPTANCGGPGDFCGNSSIRYWRKFDGSNSTLTTRVQEFMGNLAFDGHSVYHDDWGCHASHCDGDYVDIHRTPLPDSFRDIDRDGYDLLRDCNDGDVSIYPGAPQLCDGKANDCNAAGWPTPPANEMDGDGDGSRLCAGDCDDADPLRFPGNPELCDGIDNDCHGGLPANEADADGDGLRPCAGDCDDADSALGACNTPLSANPVTVSSDFGDFSIEFPSVTTPGDTSVVEVSCDSLGPAGEGLGGFAVTSNPVCVNIQTTADFGRPAEVCMTYNEPVPPNLPAEQGYRMAAFHDQPLCTDTCVPCTTNSECANNRCTDFEILATTSQDTTANLLCSATTCLSVFTEVSLLDSDGDGVYDLFDNCPTISNFFQTDGDGDRTGNPCDCRPTDSTLWSVPGQARELRMTRVSALSSSLSWLPPFDYGGQSVSPYDVLRSSNAGSFSGGTTCLAANTSSRTVTDASVPTAAHVFYYLVRGENPCGSGSLGKNSLGVERSGRNCP